MMQAMAARKVDSFRDFVLDQLGDLPALSARPMFGGHGLYLGDRFFGIIYKGQLYFRVSPKTLPDYTSRGSKPFVPFPDRPAPKKQTMNSYYEVPAEILENSAELVRWATKSAASGPAK
ncbi:MAG TPA: TfoX/Sxy family protein [Tepidisphaeraceae bacterium]|nr:TfoX/Sxy family protein [Tepidisphaeraceae bacterium]